MTKPKMLKMTAEPNESLDLQVVPRAEAAALEAIDVDRSDDGSSDENARSQDEKQVEATHRLNMWLDDVEAGLLSALQGIPEDHIQHDMLASAIKDCLVFCFTRKFGNHGAQDCDAVWSSMRVRLAVSHDNVLVFENQNRGSWHFDHHHCGADVCLRASSAPLGSNA